MTQENETEQTTDTELTARKWKHRRRIAYTSLTSAIVVILFLAVSAAVKPSVLTNIASVSDIIATFVFSAFAIVATYCGSATFHDTKMIMKR